MFQAPAAGRTTLIHMALDANIPVIAIVGYGFARYGDPIVLLLTAPWLLLTALAFPVMLAVAELYNPRSSWLSPLVSLRIVLATLSVVALFGFAYFVVVDRSEAWKLFPVLAVAMAAEVFVVRSVTAFRIRRRRAVRSALVIGAGWAGRTVIDCTLREPRLRIKVAGIIDDDLSKRNVEYKGVRVIGTGQKLPEAVAQHGVDLVITAISYTQSAELIGNLLQLKMHGTEVIDMPNFCERALGQIPIKNVEDSWFLYSGGFELLHRPFLQRFKRLFDLGAAAVGLVVSLPLMWILALLVKLDSKGPAFYLQERTGQNEKPFRLVKFRTMRNDAEGGTGPVWASVRDYRVTRVGRWLRLTRLDEIPQFINVLKGEMSFIGPRPERPFFVEKLKFDLYYIKNMSWKLDIWIAIKTLKVVFFAQGT